MRAVGYARVSTEEQVQTGVTLDAHEEKIPAYCKAKEWDLIRMIRDEGYSVKDLNRPGMQEIISGFKKKEYNILFQNKDRSIAASVLYLIYFDSLSFLYIGSKPYCSTIW